MTCKYCRQKSPREFYEAAMQLDEYKGKVLMLFGKTPEEIIRVLEKDQLMFEKKNEGWQQANTNPPFPYVKYEKERPKMTREEAIKKLNEAAPGSMTNALFVDRLEALGLIKFDDAPNYLKEAKDYLKSGIGYRLDDVGMYHRIIQGLVERIEKHPADKEASAPITLLYGIRLELIIKSLNDNGYVVIKDGKIVEGSGAIPSKERVI